MKSVKFIIMLKFVLYITMFCCLGSPPMNEENIKPLDVIFVGEIVEVVEKRSKKILWFRYGHNGWEYHFKITQAFKGVERNEIVKVFSGMTSADIHSSIGEKWLMAPRHVESFGWTASICSSSRMSEERAKKDVQFLKGHFR